MNKYDVDHAFFINNYNSQPTFSLQLPMLAGELYGLGAFEEFCGFRGPAAIA